MALIAALAIVLAPIQGAWGADNRTQLKPGWNVFSPEQDIQVGKDASQKVEQQVPLMKDPRVDNYLDALGKKLAAHAPGYKFPYQYRGVNDKAINAFALPGGFIYINRGVIETADNEAQLTGVMAHETSHVVLRHGTSQATKANAWQIPLGILGAVTGNSIGGILAQLGASFTLNSILLKYSRTDETQADVLGTQILYDSGYDPRAMAQFFEKIKAESKGKTPPQFFSDHPDPGNRMQRVSEEVDKLGGPQPNYKTDSDDFKSIKAYVMKLPAPPKGQAPQGKTSGANVRPAPPADKMTAVQADLLELQYPNNWKVNKQGNALTLAPDGLISGAELHVSKCGKWTLEPVL